MWQERYTRRRLLVDGAHPDRREDRYQKPPSPGQAVAIDRYALRVPAADAGAVTDMPKVPQTGLLLIQKTAEARCSCSPCRSNLLVTEACSRARSSRSGPFFLPLLCVFLPSTLRASPIEVATWSLE